MRIMGKTKLKDGEELDNTAYATDDNVAEELPPADEEEDDDELHVDEVKRCPFCCSLFPNSFVLRHHSDYCTETV